jgi:hypothetical protein
MGCINSCDRWTAITFATLSASFAISIKGRRGVLLVDEAHQTQVEWCFARRRAIVACAVQPYERTLPTDAEHGIGGFDNRPFNLNRTVCVFINLQLGRLPLDFDDLVTP